MHLAGYRHVFFAIEGDLRESVGLPYASLLSALINAELRTNSHVIRTYSTEETAAVVAQLVQKGGGHFEPGIPSGMAPPKPLTKRKRDADKKTIFVRQLMIVPSISENIAQKLYEHFESLPRLQQALTEKKFPKVRLDDRQCLGRGRVKKLATYLL